MCIRDRRRISQNAINAGCEVVINLDVSLMPSVVSRLRGYGARVAFWFPDHVANIGRQLMLLAPYDALFFKEPHLVERLRANLDLPVDVYKRQLFVLVRSGKSHSSRWVAAVHAATATLNRTGRDGPDAPDQMRSGRPPRLVRSSSSAVHRAK